jgi:NAD(P)H-hydrate epimerase
VPVAAQLQAVMVDTWVNALRKLPVATAILVGPGLAAESVAGRLKAEVQRLWREASVPLIVDASALDWLPRGVVAGPGPRVITPHPGEAARLLGVETAQVQGDRCGATRALSQAFGGCEVLLKGRHTVVGRAEGALSLNGSGNAQLAQGGTGDLLAGFLAGLLAQPELRSERHFMTTLRYAVWQHGAAADRLSERSRNWTPEDLAACLGDVDVV